MFVKTGDVARGCYEGGVVGVLANFVVDAVDYNTSYFLVLCDEAGEGFGEDEEEEGRYRGQPWVTPDLIWNSLLRYPFMYILRREGFSAE